MASDRKYHNLAGFLRDVRAVLAAGHELAYELCEVLREVDDLVEWDDGSDGSDSGMETPVETTGGEPQLDLDLRDAADGGSMGGPATGHGPVQSPGLDGQSGVGTPMERARALARSPLVQRHPDAVVSAAVGSLAVRS